MSEDNKDKDSKKNIEPSLKNDKLDNQEITEESKITAIIKNSCTDNKEEIQKYITNLLSKINNVLFLSGAGTSYFDNTAYPLMKDLLEKLKEDPEINKILKKILIQGNLEEIINLLK